jgi:hypothetical protein
MHPPAIKRMKIGDRECNRVELFVAIEWFDEVNMKDPDVLNHRVDVVREQLHHRMAVHVLGTGTGRVRGCPTCDAARA